MKTHKLCNPDGTETAVYPLNEFKAATIAYRYDTQYRQYLDHLWSKGQSAEEAIAALRANCGAMTKIEKVEARLAARGAKLGRPKQALSIGEAKARIAENLFGTIALLERRDMPDDTRQLLDGMKKQLAAW